MRVYIRISQGFGIGVLLSAAGMIISGTILVPGMGIYMLVTGINLLVATILSVTYIG